MWRLIWRFRYVLLHMSRTGLAHTQRGHGREGVLACATVRLSTGRLSHFLSHMSSFCVAVIGGGPAGLMAAETLADAGLRVDVYDAMPSVGRKFLLAGRGGLNLTHSEPPAAFLSRYGARAEQVAPWLEQFDAAALRQWANELGIATFVG